MDGAAWVDGRVLPLAQATLPVTDRGFLLGDAVFETLRTRSGRPFLVGDHLDRLRRSRLARRLAPEGTSFDPGHHVTDDERKLSTEDLAAVRSAFVRVDERRFGLVGRLHRLIPRCGARMRGRLQRCDRLLLGGRGLLRSLGDTVVLNCYA